ncbi:MAG: TetR/AcrR family transcriptional regulator [Actinomycetota bacterium]|nr:TetR/AcrR family transcriptional regulator [Actinomycetota bacterium]MDA8209652.1 TetR/AcrR family transcriptional regulator [Actinomycetota bacterium]
MSTRAPESAEAGYRTRDPARKERILEAAAGLLARNGFHSVSMAEIGNQAGITGSGIYRHFESKSAILVALFDRTIDDLLADEAATMEAHLDLAETLERLIAAQVEFVVRDRALAQVYHNEIRNLPDEDQVRLRRKQRLYIEEWVHVVREIHGGLDDATARALVHAAISAIQSTLFHNVGLPGERQREILARAAKAVLAPGPLD